MKKCLMFQKPKFYSLIPTPRPPPPPLKSVCEIDDLDQGLGSFNGEIKSSICRGTLIYQNGTPDIVQLNCQFTASVYVERHHFPRKLASILLIDSYFIFLGEFLNF